MENAIGYDDFLKLLDEYMYKTIGKIRASINTCATHYREMFKKLDKNTANFILDLAEFHGEFHPDNIKSYRNIIN